MNMNLGLSVPHVKANNSLDLSAAMPKLGVTMLIDEPRILPPLKSLAERLRWARGEKGWSRPTFAKRAGATADQVTKIETGKIRQPRNIKQLASSLDVPEAWLQFGTQNYGGKLSMEAVRLACRWQSLTDAQRDLVARQIALFLDKEPGSEDP